MTKKILITGAGTGLGKGAAFGLAKKGHDVIATVEIESQVTELRALAKEQKLKLTVEKIDITDPADWEFAWKKFSDIDVLLNNAGISLTGTLAEMPVSFVKTVFDTNVFGSLSFSQGFIKEMMKRKSGKVIFVSSVAGFLGGSLTGAYAMSKHAIEAMAETLSDELEPFGIQVATINPGPYQTGFNDRMIETRWKWYDSDIHMIDEREANFPMEQYDPQEMIDKMIEVAEEDTGLFRNVLPKEYEEIIKDTQSAAWTRQQNKPLSN